ncbi:MAG: methyltransferase domain-containing protein [Alphaproteobacteria bacterium]|nr:MAG: methyltransferase domain-containing protein [Alphaproteobacteria bacterium]
MNQVDKAGAQYWDNNWTDADRPILFSEQNKSLDNYVNIQLHEYFKSLFGEKKNFSILEIGSANSIWPIYFNQFFDARADGLDYSEVGCQKSRDLLKHHNIPGNIYCADLFEPPKEIQNKYDYVVSFGVVEHFEDTANCLQSCAKLLKTGGTVITLIPNIPSIIGLIQKYVDREVYDVHMPLTKKKLSKAHQKASLMLQKCEYFMSINLSVVNSGSFSSNKYNKHFRHMLSAPSKFCWILEKYGIRIPRNRFTSPYIIAVAQKT